MDYEKLRLKAENYWRQYRKLILLIGVAAIFGVVIATLNFYVHEKNTAKYQLEEQKTVSNQKDFRFHFTLSEPRLATGTTIRLSIENIADEQVTVEVNNREVETVGEGSARVDVPGEILRQNNTVRIYKKQLGFEEQRITEAEVTSTTNLRELIFILLNLASILLIFVPLGYVKYKQYTKRKKMEQEFPEFLRDVVHGTRAGMSLPQAIQNTEASNYSYLGEEVERMSAQLEWGIPFDEVLQNFSRRTHSPLVKRSTDTIIQAYTSGGNIQDVLESVGENLRSVKQLKEERQSQLYGEMITGYIVYFIFIGILIALTSYLLPNLASASQQLGGSLNILGGGAGNLQENISTYKIWFRRLVYIQAIFSGLIIGKLSEGELRAGFKHSGILFAAGYLAVTFFL